MLLSEHSLELSSKSTDRSLLAGLSREVLRAMPEGFVPLRIAVSESSDAGCLCEVGGLSGGETAMPRQMASIFDSRPRGPERTDRFTTVMAVPTGIGCELGGHAGDAGAVARLLGHVSDELVLHPNVVNASDVNEMPENSLYVEGSVLCRLLMGSAGLQRSRNNRVLVVIDDHEDDLFVNMAVNTVSGARSSYGLECTEVVRLNPAVKLRARFSPSGRAAGRVEDFDGLCELLDQKAGEYDAVAVSSVIDVPEEFHQGYFDAGGEMVNPWGGVEAMLTHALSSIYELPTAHAPMFESREIANMNPGIVDPRMAAEAVSNSFLQCTLKGLQQSPQIVTDEAAMTRTDVLSAEDVSCLVIPDGCLGLPTLAALDQGITVIAVQENRNVMKNDLSVLPWQPGQFYQVANYWEAAGLIAAIRAGVAPGSTRRPLANTIVSSYTASQGSSQGGVQGTERLESGKRRW